MRWSTWWRDMPGPAKFRLYTRLTLQGAVVAAVIALSISSGGPRPVVAIVLAGIATIAALEARTELATWPGATFRRWAIPASAAVLTAVWGASAVVANTAGSEAAIEQARVAGVCAAMFGALCLISFSRHRWWLVVALSVATGFALGAPAGTELRVMSTTLALGLFVVTTTLLTLWGLRIVDDLEHAKDLGAELQLAEERLRFARDLHDVVGRSFSAIAVKSELAAALSRAGVADRATAEMDEVRALAVESMAEMRQLVRGYRDIDLEGEVAGARALLSSAGCALVVEGDPAAVPSEVHELAAWVVREGTTNIVKHSAARSATLAFGRSGMSLRNDGASDAPKERSGLLGLAERLATGGATLDTVVRDGEFILEIHWETA